MASLPEMFSRIKRISSINSAWNFRRIGEIPGCSVSVRLFAAGYSVRRTARPASGLTPFFTENATGPFPGVPPDGVSGTRFRFVIPCLSIPDLPEIAHRLADGGDHREGIRELAQDFLHLDLSFPPSLRPACIPLHALSCMCMHSGEIQRRLCVNFALS